MPPTGSVLTITFIIIGILVTLAGMQLLVSALLPRAVREARGMLEERPRRAALWGLLHLAISFVGIGILTKLGGLGQVLTFVWVTTVVVIAVCGLVALSRIVGNRLPSAADTESPWRPTLRGVVVTELAFLAPVVGWTLFVIALVPCGGAGLAGVIRAWRARRAAQRALAAPPPPTPAGSDELVSAA